ncbi:MAG: ABC transporter ATP-binding protein [Lachnospiraceae bacterium]|nr:ABC transporter ATP-binding protein [Lachnospiraceae bacterium]
MNLKAQEIEITLSKKEIVKKVSLQVKENEFVGLLGPNGSGKTTLLKSIYRVLKPSGGVVLLDGQDMSKMNYKETARRLGVVSQFTNMSFDFSVEEVVLMGRSPHKKALSSDTEEDYRLVEEALRRVDMLSFRERSFQTLSGGEKQRIHLARTLSQK